MTFTRTFKPGDRVRLAALPSRRGFFRRLDALGAIVEWDGLGQRLENPADIRHSPVDIIGPGLKPDPTACPSCGTSDICIEPDALIGPTPGTNERHRRGRVLFCMACEHCEELKR